MKLLAEWFWTDRWMGSSGFLLPMEARGVYREMLTQAWRRGARLPNDHEAIRRAIGATEAEWARSWPLVSKFWRIDGDTIVNDTQRSVYEEAIQGKRRKSERGKAGARAQAARKQAVSTAQAPSQAVLKHQPPSPSPSPSLTPFPEVQDQKHRASAERIKPVEIGTDAQYTLMAHEAIRTSTEENHSDSLSNITAIFKALCASRGFHYDGVLARKAIDQAIKVQQKAGVA